MIKSMTGFGSASVETENLSVQVEIRSLNSKFADLFVKMSNLFSNKELETKNLLTQKLERGKISAIISYLPKRSGINTIKVNTDLVTAYYQALKETADTLGSSDKDIFRIVMMMPDAYAKEENEELLEEDWKIVIGTVEEAIRECDKFRLHEGKALEGHLKEGIIKIGTLLESVEGRDPERVVKIREKLTKQVNELANNESFDKNRFEQELIYYIEKLDITEEKVRLKKHLDYFIETMDEPANTGKKLGFISQEIGREINTIGSKANDHDIQKLVVSMKDELEKIKEQLNNIL
jgi:uncharacterized protein (TIGR00255 family)